MRGNERGKGEEEREEEEGREEDREMRKEKMAGKLDKTELFWKEVIKNL
jgi:hypothetical protein